LTKSFASHADLGDKRVEFTKLDDCAYAYVAEGDPNSGVIVGDDSVMVVDTQATPVMAEDVVRQIRKITDKPIKYVVLSHYHAVRVLGASAYGAEHVIASADTHDLIAERGAADMKSEIERFPRLFRSVDSIPGLTRPTITFRKEMTIWLGSLEVKLLQLGRGHTKGDTVVWLPKQRILFSGDLVESGATPYTGDAYLGEWPQTLNNIAALEPVKVVPGRGTALQSGKEALAAIASTRDFVTSMYQSVRSGVQDGKALRAIYEDTYAALHPRFGGWVIFDHCLPFDVSRAYDEATAHPEPRIWTAERDKELWQSLEG